MIFVPKNLRFNRNTSQNFLLYFQIFFYQLKMVERGSKCYLKRHSKEWKTKVGENPLKNSLLQRKVDDMNNARWIFNFFYKTSGWIFFTFFFDDDIATFSVPFFLTIWLIHLTTNLDLRIIHCLALHRSLECTTGKKIVHWKNKKKSLKLFKL